MTAKDAYNLAIQAIKTDLAEGRIPDPRTLRMRMDEATQGLPGGVSVDDIVAARTEIAAALPASMLSQEPAYSIH